MELLAGRGWPCKVFCGPALDFDRTIPALLGELGVSFVEKKWDQGPGVPFSLFHYAQGGVPVSIFEAVGGKRQAQPVPAEGKTFLGLCVRIFQQYRPDIMLTYGGSWFARAVMRLARERGIRVVFGLHNFAYEKAGDLFRHVDAVRVASKFAQEHYRRAINLDSTVIPGPWDWSRIRCEKIDRRYLTFVNPSPQKGVFVFVRIATELARLRPDIPLLVVESRAKAPWMAKTGLDLSGLKNLHMMENTPDPRDFYRISKVVLMPSLWRETFGRVAAEALMNGIPVLAVCRGGLSEVLADAGFLFDIPDKYTPNSREVPTAEELAPWIETIIRLWDDKGFYDCESARCAAAENWRPEKLAPQFEEFLLRAFSKGS
jgi:glycosyltransferase involved in cell wall biosynthesis